MSAGTGLLEGKTALITGSNRGIGRAIAETFAEHGATIIACARVASPQFSALCADISERTGREVTPMHFDLSDEEQVKAAVRAVTGSKRPLDILVNNAGVATGSFFHMTPLQSVRDVFETNFFGPVLLTQGLSKYMVRARTGTIINVASTAGILGSMGTTAYGASKAALMLVTKTWAAELGRSGVRVNAIAPNVTRTDMLSQMEAKALDRLIEATALKRPAEASEIANVALFLASDLSSYVTGQVLRVDGGMS